MNVHLCTATGARQVVPTGPVAGPILVRVTDGEYTIRLTPDEALMLSDWLYRMYDSDEFRALVDRDRAVWAALHRIGGTLETTLTEVFAADYAARVDAARVRLVDTLGDLGTGDAHLDGTGAARFAPEAGPPPGAGLLPDAGPLPDAVDEDLAVANLNSNNVSILFGSGSGTFASAVTYGVGSNPQSVAIGDLDADGDADLAADMQDAIEARLADAGFRHYETSAFARPGQECVHNLNYWTFGDYLGIGAGAHSKISFPGRIVRQVRWREPNTYMDKARQGQATSNENEVSLSARPFEFMMNALRLKDGFELQRFAERPMIGWRKNGSTRTIAFVRRS